MANEALLEKLSAYADGELDAAGVAEVEAALARDAALGRTLAQFKRLQAEAARLPVPSLDEDTGATLWALVQERTVAQPAQAGTLSHEAWKKVSGRLPEVPQVDPERWGRVWEGISRRTVAAAAVHETAVLHKREEASERHEPLMADLTPGEMPAVQDFRAAPKAPRKAVSIWPAAAFLAAAALVIVAATAGLVGLPQHPDPAGTPAPHVVQGSPHGKGPGPIRVAHVEYDPLPEVLDNRYLMVVKHVPGLDEPVVCFFLQEPEGRVDQRK